MGFDPKYQLPTVKHGGGNVMVCDGTGPIHQIEGIVDGNGYKSMI